jgi:aminopeptidase N
VRSGHGPGVRRPYAARRPPPAPRSKPRLPVILLTLMASAGCWRVADTDREFRDVDEPVPAPTPAEVARRLITGLDLSRSIDFLASDDRRGRGVPSPGLDRAAAWVAQRFQAAGLEPAGQDGGYIQYWWVAGAGPDSARVPNVAALAPGSSLTRAGEYVVVMAHLDHLGVGEPDESGDSIFNGADDNASGVAGLVEVVEALVALAERPPRPVLFLALSGKESGLQGAERYVSAPTVDLSEAVAVLNLDMISRNHPDSVSVLGHGYSRLGPMLSDVAAGNPALRLSVVPEGGLDPDSAAERYRTGDHFPFAREGIPAVVITTGRHQDYHQPSDEPGRVDADKAARVSRFVFLAAHRLATMEERPIDIDIDNR